MTPDAKRGPGKDLAPIGSAESEHSADNPPAAVIAASIAAIESGCICRPDLVVHGPDHVTVKHDAWCPMLHHSTQYSIFTLPDGCDR